MPEEAVLEQAPPFGNTQGPPVSEPVAPSEPVDISAQPLDAEIKLAEAAAAQYFADNNQETAKPRLRGPDGQFIAEKAPEPVAPIVVAPKLDSVWAEAARLEGFTPEEIAKFGSEQDVQHNIAVKRYGALQRAGIDPMEFAQYRQWRQESRQPPPKAAVVDTAAVVEPFKLTIDEGPEGIDPALIKPMREMEAHINKLKETLGAENQQLRQTLAQLQGTVEQSAQAAQQAANEARTASEWDNAAKATPGFVEAMGLPSEVKRLSNVNPNDPKVQKYMAYAVYFKPIYDRYASILGENNVALQRVMADAFQASPFAVASAASNGSNNNGTGTYGSGSMIRSAPNKGTAPELTEQGNDLAAEMQRALDVARRSWSDNGGINPYLTHNR